MNMQEVEAVLAEITFDHHPTIYVAQGGTFFEATGWIQIRDSDIPLQFNSGRKWRLSQFMTKSEVVQTALVAYLSWVEHEARESFKYKGWAIFGPHFNVDSLVDLASDVTSYEVRA